MIEVEVERLPRPDDPAPDPRLGLGKRFRSAFEPVLAGFVLDVVDFVPMPPPVGFVVGALVGSQLLRNMPLTRRAKVLGSLACGVYCAQTITNMLPLATLLGAFSRFLLPRRE